LFFFILQRYILFCYILFSEKQGSHMTERQPKLWTKDFVIAACAAFFVSFVFHILMVTIALYATETYHATTSEAGLAAGMFIIGALVVRLFVGYLIEAFGLKRMLLVSLLIYILSSFLYLLKVNLAFLLMNRFVHGVGMGMATTVTSTIVAQIIPPQRRGEGIGIYSLSPVLANCIGPFAGLLLSQYVGFQAIFILCLVLSIVGLGISLVLRVPPSPALSPAAVKGIHLSNFIEPKVVPVCLIILISGFCYSGVVSFLSFYAQELGVVKAASVFFMVFAIAILLSRPFTGRLFDLKGANFIMYPAIVLFAAGMMLLSMAQNSFTLLLAGAIIGLGYGNIQSITQTLAVHLSPPNRIAMATSTFFILLDVGFGFGPYLLGFLIPYTGYGHLYFLLSFVILGLIGLYELVNGKKERAGKKLHASIHMKKCRCP